MGGTKKKRAASTALAARAAEMKAAATTRRRARAKALVALIARRAARIVEDFYDMGEALRELARERLYEALGYATFEELLASQGLLSRMQAHKLIRVVESIPREDALALGLERSYALIAYAAATPETDSAAQLIREDASLAGTPVSKASRRTIEAAARAARPKAKPTAKDAARAKLEREMLRLARQAHTEAGLPRATFSVEGDAVVARTSFRALAKLRP